MIKTWKTHVICPEEAKIEWPKSVDSDWMLWALDRSGKPLTKAQSVSLAVSFAEHVLPKFEMAHPNDDRPRKALEAAKTWLREPTEACRKAAERAWGVAAGDVCDDAGYAAAYAAATAAARQPTRITNIPPGYIHYVGICSTIACAAAPSMDGERAWQADEIRKQIANPFEASA